jgi:hypothetical protein
MVRGALVAAALTLAWPGPSRAQPATASAVPARDASALVVVGQDGRSTTLSAADLDAMRLATADLAHNGGGPPVAYAGPLLWAVLDRAGVLGADAPGRVRRVVVATGRDGYTAILAMAEVDPELGGKPVIVATRADGQTVTGGLRLVVPGEKHPARSVHDLARLEVR